ncbi:MAG: hypothetical protein ABI597_12825 [Gammaproteobacteria bacterium]
MKNIFKQNTFRFRLSELIAFILAMIINYYYAASDCFLIPLTALYVMQTPIGNSFYQGMRRFSLILILASIAALIVASMMFLYQIMHDVIIGTTIGIAVNLLVLPRQADAGFREAVIPLIKNYQNYFLAIASQFLVVTDKTSSNALIEAQLLNLPDWVYVRGFNSSLQVGYQFFLVTLEQLSDVLFALHHLAHYAYSKPLIEKIESPMRDCVEHVNAFFSSLITVLELKTLTHDVNDLEADIVALEKEFYKIAPASLELIDLRQEYVYTAEFIYSLKDMRQLLVRLGQALR